MTLSDTKVETISWQTLNRRTEIRVGGKLVGSINSYNNKWTQFFALFFKKAIKVSLNNEYRVFNKKSFDKFIKKHPLNETTHKLKSFIINHYPKPKINLNGLDKLTKNPLSLIDSQFYSVMQPLFNIYVPKPEKINYHNFPSKMVGFKKKYL